jgi:type IV pilus assembly protein PilE
MHPMENRAAVRSTRQSGFTLIELMVTVAIVATLATIAVSSYSSQMRKSRRTEAKTALLDLAGREERYLSTQGHYSDVPADLGYAPLNSTVAFPQNLASNYYTIAATKVDGTATAPATFTATAQAVAGSPQAQDTQCYKLIVDSLGNQTSQTSGGADTTATGGCWP